EYARGLLGAIAVAAHHLRAADQDLAAVGEALDGIQLHRRARERMTDDARDAALVAPGDGRAGRGLRQAPALEDGDAVGFEPAEGGLAHWRGRAEGEPQRKQRLAGLAVLLRPAHEPVVDAGHREVDAGADFAKVADQDL